MRALILMQMTGGVDVAKQMQACWDYVTHAQHLEFSMLLHQGAGVKEAVAAVQAGEAAVVVAAYRVPELELTKEVERYGGKVEYVHSSTRGRLTVRDIIANLYRRAGWSANTIAMNVGTDPEEVLDHLRRAGIKRPRRRE